MWRKIQYVAIPPLIFVPADGNTVHSILSHISHPCYAVNLQAHMKCFVILGKMLYLQFLKMENRQY